MFWTLNPLMRPRLSPSFLIDLILGSPVNKVQVTQSSFRKRNYSSLTTLSLRVSVVRHWDSFGFPARACWDGTSHRIDKIRFETRRKAETLHPRSKPVTAEPVEGAEERVKH